MTGGARIDTAALGELQGALKQFEVGVAAAMTDARRAAEREREAIEQELLSRQRTLDLARQNLARCEAMDAGCGAQRGRRRNGRAKGG